VLLFFWVFAVPGSVHHADAGIVLQLRLMSLKEIPEQTVKRAGCFSVWFLAIVSAPGTVKSLILLM
jgi:hypothetical protein